MTQQSIQEFMAAAPVRQAADYAADISSVTDSIIASIELCTDEQWQRVSAGEVWPVAVIAHHTGAVLGAFAGVLAALETSAAVPQFSAEDVDRNNARHARDFATVNKPETVEFLRTNSTALTESTLRLSGEQLTEVAGNFGGFELTISQILEFAVIGHLREHLASIRTTIAD